MGHFASLCCVGVIITPRRCNLQQHATIYIYIYAHILSKLHAKTPTSVFLMCPWQEKKVGVSPLLPREKGVWVLVFCAMPQICW